MKRLIRANLFLCLLLIATTATAEGVSQNLGRIWGSYFAVQALQEACGKAFSTDKNRYDEIFGGWMARNREVAEQTVSLFYETLKTMVESEEELVDTNNRLLQMMATLESRAIAEVYQVISDSSQDYCDSMADRLGTGNFELFDLYGDELERLGISPP